MEMRGKVQHISINACHDCWEWRDKTESMDNKLDEDRRTSQVTGSEYNGPQPNKT